MTRIALDTGPENAGQRLDRALAAACPQLSRAALQKAVRQGCASVDGQPVREPDLRLRAGQHVELALAEARGGLRPESGDVRVVWQDADLVVCDKSAGLTVHPCPSCPARTLVQRLIAQFPQLGALGGERPGIVHRLDKDTSGLIVVALSEPARLALSAAFARREVEKEYLALVSGRPAERGECHEALGRHPTARTRMAVVAESRGGRPAHSRWRRLWSAPDGSVSLLAVRIFTGRTHQIRVHLAHAGHPLLGDKLYAPPAVAALAPRQMLHAWRLRFRHPRSGEVISLTAPPPPDFTHSAVAACRRMARIVVTGSPGCGKSALRGALAALGLPAFSADDDVARLYARGGEAASWLAQRLGGAASGPDGAVDKAALMPLLEGDAALRREVETAVHALVRRDIEHFWERSEAAGADMAVAEVPLYLECGWQEAFTPRPFVVGVACPQGERWQRMAAHRGWDEARMAALDSWQWPAERKLAACDLVVDNSGTLDALARQAEKLVASVRERRDLGEHALARRLEALWSAERPDSGA